MSLLIYPFDCREKVQEVSVRGETRLIHSVLDAVAVASIFKRVAVVPAVTQQLASANVFFFIDNSLICDNEASSYA